MTQKPSFWYDLLDRSHHYQFVEHLDDLEKQGDLTTLPLLPLQRAFHGATPVEAAHYIPLLSAEQRQLLMDLDLWKGDELSLDHGYYWLQSYACVEDDEVKLEFVKSSSFMLFLKTRLTLSTFDIEDPCYPDHDNFFVTDDQLLLIEYDEEFPCAVELQELIRHLYAQEGVERAYSLLFKLVVDSVSLCREEEFQLKSFRLSEYGFPEYSDVLALHQPFSSISKMDHFILHKHGGAAHIEEFARREVIPFFIVPSFKKEASPLEDELAKLTNTKRYEHLRFNFIRLVNATLSYGDVWNQGRLAHARVGENSEAIMRLGLSYAKHLLGGDAGSAPLFDKFDFSDLFKIGHTLVKLSRQKLTNLLKETPFAKGDKDFFFGHALGDFLDETFATPIKFKNSLLLTFEDYTQFLRSLHLFEQLLPYVLSFFAPLEKMIQDQKIHDAFYVNYKVVEIDFEAILLSYFVRFCYGDYKASDLRLGVLKEEFFKFIDEGWTREKIELFQKQFGFDQVFDFIPYMEILLDHHVKGYRSDELSEDNLRHIGGVLILATA